MVHLSQEINFGTKEIRQTTFVVWDKIFKLLIRCMHSYMNETRATRQGSHSLNSNVGVWLTMSKLLNILSAEYQFNNVTCLISVTLSFISGIRLHAFWDRHCHERTLDNLILLFNVWFPVNFLSGEIIFEIITHKEIY